MKYFDAHNYVVKVGNKECTEVRVENNLISCKPPQDEPDISSEVQVILKTKVTFALSSVLAFWPKLCNKYKYFNFQI